MDFDYIKNKNKLKQKLQVNVGKNTSSEDRIQVTTRCFYDIGTIEDREYSERSSKITEEQVDGVHHVCEK